MDPEKRAAVISLFEEMGRKEQETEPERKRDLRVNETMIIGSTIVLCVPESMEGVLSSLLKGK